MTFEGGEGAGKTTQVALLAERLASAGLDVLTTREPGGTPGAEAIRRLIVEGETDRWSPAVETLLHMAARADHVMRVIRPALDRGTWVLCDRFSDSTRVYQGLAGNAGLAWVDRLHELVFATLRPDLTLLLDLPTELGLERRGHGGGAGRHERLGQAFHEDVRRSFLELARLEADRFAVIDASRTIDSVAGAIAATVEHRLAIPLGRH